MHLGFKRNCVCVFTVWSVAVFKACSVVCDSGKVIGYDHWFVSEVLQRSNTRCRLFHIARMGHNTDNTQTDHVCNITDCSLVVKV